MSELSHDCLQEKTIQDIDRRLTIREERGSQLSADMVEIKQTLKELVTAVNDLKIDKAYTQNRREEVEEIKSATRTLAKDVVDMKGQISAMDAEKQKSNRNAPLIISIVAILVSLATTVIFNLI